MAKMLHIHSVFFDILGYMGMNENDGLLLIIFAGIIISMWAYLYILHGYKICLVIMPAICVYCINWMHHIAIRAEIDATLVAELSKINRCLLGYTILYIPLMVLVRYLKIKYGDPWMDMLLETLEEWYLDNEKYN